MNEEQFEEEMANEMQDLQSEDGQESQEDQFFNQQEINDAYGAPEPEERYNASKFISDSLHIKEPEKVTFLSLSELGAPLFNVRFLLDIEDISKYYLDETARDLGVENQIAKYFREKINNISESGMSKEGALQMANITKKMDSTRQRIKNLEPMKGGSKR